MAKEHLGNRTGSAMETIGRALQNPYRIFIQGFFWSLKKTDKLWEALSAHLAVQIEWKRNG